MNNPNNHTIPSQILNIVLFEPEIPQNTGNIARLCACIGAKLYLVGRLGFSLTDRYLKRAGLDYWDKVELERFDDFEELRSANKNANFYYFTTKTNKIYTSQNFKKGDFFVFGPETRGLREELLNENKDFCLTIPMKKVTRSLNLSNSAAIAAYEAVRQFGLTFD